MWDKRGNMCNFKWMTWLQISANQCLRAILGELILNRAGRVYFCSLCSFLKGLFCLFQAPHLVVSIPGCCCF